MASVGTESKRHSSQGSGRSMHKHDLERRRLKHGSDINTSHCKWYGKVTQAGQLRDGIPVTYARIWIVRRMHRAFRTRRRLCASRGLLLSPHATPASPQSARRQMRVGPR